ncbi:hypothetical protein AAZX31_11G170500 [Glycine max]|nr:hypothetical protein GLYMA_11G195550v4 [Glycine max]KAH1159412.1 hypothetical protein GYH30_031225 [Glycine max]
MTTQKILTFRFILFYDTLFTPYNPLFSSPQLCHQPPFTAHWALSMPPLWPLRMSYQASPTPTTPSAVVVLTSTIQNNTYHRQKHINNKTNIINNTAPTPGGAH